MMVRLENIKRTESSISCDFYPEDSVLPGKMSIDIPTLEMKCYLPDGYEWCSSHVQHAALTLRKLFEAETLPSRKLIMWY